MNVRQRVGESNFILTIMVIVDACWEWDRELECRVVVDIVGSLVVVVLFVLRG